MAANPDDQEPVWLASRFPPLRQASHSGIRALALPSVRVHRIERVPVQLSRTLVSASHWPRAWPSVRRRQAGRVVAAVRHRSSPSPGRGFPHGWQGQSTDVVSMPSANGGRSDSAIPAGTGAEPLSGRLHFNGLTSWRKSTPAPLPLARCRESTSAAIARGETRCRSARLRRRGGRRSCA